MKKVMVFGTFDIFHPGHDNFLKQARKCGDYLIVVVARDETVLAVKGRRPLNDESFRIKKIRESGLADEVVPGRSLDKKSPLSNPPLKEGKGSSRQYEIIKKFRPDVICLGYDQKFFVDGLEDKLEEFGLGGTEIIRLKPFKTDIYKSSKLR